MPELLKLETPDWQLIVWSKDIIQSQQLLSHTLSNRKKVSPVTRLRFDPVLHLTDLDSRESDFIYTDRPLFFENKLYEFDFQFKAGRPIYSPVIKHRLRAIEDAFHYSGLSLRGSINFGNDVGWFKLVLCYHLNNKEIIQAISFEVFPTKMDIETDLSDIQQIIDKSYPLFRFSFVQKTEQELARSRKPHERFPLLWLSQFESLRDSLEKGIKQVLNTPHFRLLPRTKILRIEQLKGRLPPKLEEQVRTALKSNNLNKRYQLDSKFLSSDTPENRFIKMVLIHCVRELSAFIRRVKANDVAPENSRLSNTFYDQLELWKRPLESYLKRPFFKDIGDYDDLNNESLVLHHKAGYANVYRAWQQLKLYLNVFGQHARISMKSIAELYEVWCILEIRRILIDDLGFKEVVSRNPSLSKNGMERTLNDGIGATFKLERDSIKLRLAHEPLFKPSNSPEPGYIYSWITSQKPDILLEAEFESGEKLRWIFDAKYRISLNDNSVDYAPDDAINQMHRYRDALIHIHRADDEVLEKTRPIFGAFILYPGWFKNCVAQNPYQKAIDEIGIGAFPLLPNSKNHWLRDFLVAQFGAFDDAHIAYKLGASDHFYVQEAARISYTGMTLSKYQDLALLVALGSKRSEIYLENFRLGLAKWYHLPESTSATKRVQREVMRELKFCAFVVYFPDDSQRRIEFSYAIKSVRLMKRDAISELQAGAKPSLANADKYYWLFELGTSTKLSSSIDVSGIRDFKFRLANVDDLNKTTTWADLPNRYDFLQKT